jgi:tRNA(adenine34) deaminase
MDTYMIAVTVMRLEDVAAGELACADFDFMELALAVARQGASVGEVPIGAVVVCRGKVLASAHNAPIALSDPTAHAEVLALREAARRVENYRLPDATLYVTVEPCAMCVGAIVQARVTRVVFGCRDPKSGALGSVYDLAAGRQVNHQFRVSSGIRAAKARSLLQEFFALRRGA